MADRPFLVTGFEPYGGRGINPAHETMQALDGRVIEGLTVAGRGLPVSLREVRSRLPQLIEEIKPAAVICLGLWPGEATIRLERMGINVVDYEIADNDGSARPAMARWAPTARSARLATLPLRAIEAALLEEGIPARISSTAGTFLCNACLFTRARRAGGTRAARPGRLHPCSLCAGAGGGHALEDRDRKRRSSSISARTSPRWSEPHRQRGRAAIAVTLRGSPR